MKISKKRVVFLKLLIVIGFIYTCFYFYDKLTLKISKLNTQRKIETNNIINSLNIRTRDFYIKKPENIISNKKTKDINRSKNLKPKQVQAKNNANYYIQVGTYSKKENAIKKTKELSNFNTIIEEKTINNRTYNQVVITDIKTRDEANNILKKIPNSENFLIRVRY